MVGNSVLTVDRNVSKFSFLNRRRQSRAIFQFYAYVATVEIAYLFLVSVWMFKDYQIIASYCMNLFLTMYT